MDRVYKLFILTILILTSGCSQTTFSKNEFDKLTKENGVGITDTTSFPNSEIFRIYQDYGIGGTSYYIFHKKGSGYYHKLDKESKYISGQIWKNYILQTCSYMGQASDTGQWIKVEKIITQTNNEVISFDYRKEVLSDKQSDCIYKTVNGELVLLGSLKDYCSLHDLDSGIYYLAPPAIFYTNKMDIKELENKYK